MGCRHASEFPLHMLNEGWRWMEVEDPTEQIQTHKQQRERQPQAVQPNSASLYAATHFTHLTSERTHFRKGSKVMYLQSWSWWVCSTVRVCACSLPAHIIYQQCLQCVCKCLSMSERIPLCVSCIITLGGGDWAGRTRTVKKWTRHIFLVQFCFTICKNMNNMNHSS